MKGSFLAPSIYYYYVPKFNIQFPGKGNCAAGATISWPRFAQSCPPLLSWLQLAADLDQSGLRLDWLDLWKKQWRLRNDSMSICAGKRYIREEIKRAGTTSPLSSFIGSSCQKFLAPHKYFSSNTNNAASWSCATSLQLFFWQKFIQTQWSRTCFINNKRRKAKFVGESHDGSFTVCALFSLKIGAFETKPSWCLCRNTTAPKG